MITLISGRNGQILRCPEKRGFKFSGRFEVVCFDKLGKFKWKEDIRNLTTNQGLNSILSVYFGAGSQISTWYVGLKGSNQTPLAAWTNSSINSAFTEYTAYSEAVRQTWTPAAASSQQITNSASPATFTMNASGSVYGAFLISNSTKSGTTGILYSITDFSSLRSVVSGDAIKVVYTITAADV